MVGIRAYPNFGNTHAYTHYALISGNTHYIRTCSPKYARNTHLGEACSLQEDTDESAVQDQKEQCGQRTRIHRLAIETQNAAATREISLIAELSRAGRQDNAHNIVNTH